ncbi:hypothetical protein JCM21714_2557 [Gracilibacillus boraciitolerans JCM 21714]|uniref:DUF1694 domain-containing protein n=1 Tax=Gracilibacillus boraciitolerans JCM 21714 TaxID=1298598 RepID=W4VJU7_9BACI|nr:YueI family protein [Gracilibacillus boraciitolerans]GAE93472.1 hypothetical protein JCM21714_2557 [Gracilibacillus boraciitolerans JCM 21714]
MASKDVDDYLQEGIYGKREINPDEKRKFLGTYRERVILVLSKSEVRGEKGLPEIEKAILEYPQATLLMNGNMNFRFFKPFRDIANKHEVSYTSVTNREAESDYGIVLASKVAVDKEEIFLPEEKEPHPAKKNEKKPWWKKILGV